ncbi:MAG: accessory factor UbiK family protein [Rhodospirillaceae bacterium]|nr:accessory factor UbiK family protein [Rhodospirillaceae bacterium]
MQTSNRLLDDLAKVANGAASAVTGLKDDAEGMVRRQLQKLLADQDLVTREEFEAVKALAANARAGEEALQKRVDALEAQLKKTKKANKAPVKKPSAKK